ncbi:MAG TPA: DNA-formamidopyrimidine glycosylase family protein [Motilibacterales bacterium]|nr:DNA-formamidopyrimidine glycosylase family protein [Motilibacterales bacterium]
MPEGDAVRRTARRLDAALAGGTLVRAELRVPRFATVDLRGMQVLGTGVMGKHMLTRLVDDRREWTLHHHLRMDGSWRTGQPGSPGAPGHQIRVWLGTPSAQAVGVRVHMVEVRPTREEGRWVGHLGPDVMADGFDVELAAGALAQADRPLVEALLDQRIVCGMGTIWASELACVAGADPFARTSKVDGLAEALAAIRTRMLRAVDTPASTSRRELRVFERTGQPCRRCGTRIRSGRVGVAPMDRPTYWCPQCQPPRP